MKCRLFAAIFVLLFTTVHGQGALDFSYDDYVIAPQGGPLDSTSRTVEIWAKKFGGNLVSWGATTAFNNFKLYKASSQKVAITVGTYQLLSTQVFNDTNWHHIAVTYDRNATPQMCLYIDGQLQASGNPPNALNTLQSTMAIGGSGIIEELRIWNVARTASEIASARQKRFCQIPLGLVHRYSFDEGIPNGLNTNDTIAYDSVGTNHAVLHNFSLDGNSGNWTIGLPFYASSTLTGFVVDTVCDQRVSPSGKYIWTQTGVYYDTILRPSNCDSVVVSEITVYYSDTTSISATGCNKYRSPSGKYLWKTSGNYIDILPNKHGCDSTLRISLTVNYVDTNVFINSFTLSAWQSFAKYQWCDCSNGFVPLAGDTNQVFYMPGNGSYAVIINKNGCIDTSTCLTIPNVDVPEDELENSILIYPNPTNGAFKVTLPNEIKEAKWILTDECGRMIYSGLMDGTTNLSLPLKPGVYVLRLFCTEVLLTKGIIVY